MIALQMLMFMHNSYQNNMLLAYPTTPTGPIVDGGWTVFCPTCKEWHHPSEIKEQSDLCEGCHAERYNTCPHCGDDFYWEEAVKLHDSTKICKECYKDHCFECDYCGNDYPQQERATCEKKLCKKCYTEHYFVCDVCSETFPNHEGNGEGMCEQCADPYDDDLNTHSPVFRKFGYPKDKVWMGVELELECEEGRRGRCTRKAINTFKNFATVQDDCTLRNGFEIASQPATLEIQREHWERFFMEMDDACQTSPRCGMHVHISRDPISPLTLGKMIVFYNTDHNREFIQAIAGRDHIYNGNYDESKKVSDACKDDQDRYQAVNISNTDTIEIRVFASTDYKMNFMGRLEFVHAVLTYCRSSGINDLTHEKFTSWVKQQGKTYHALWILMQSVGIMPYIKRKAS